MGQPYDQLGFTVHKLVALAAVVVFVITLVRAGKAARLRGFELTAEVGIREPRRLIREHRERTGERLSFAACIVACLACAVAEHAHLNALRRGGQLVLLDDVRNRFAQLLASGDALRELVQGTTRQRNLESPMRDTRVDYLCTSGAGSSWLAMRNPWIPDWVPR